MMSGQLPDLKPRLLQVFVQSSSMSFFPHSRTRHANSPHLGAKQGAPVDQPGCDLGREVDQAQGCRLPYERLHGPIAFMQLPIHTREKLSTAADKLDFNNVWDRVETSLLPEVDNRLWFVVG